MIKSKLMNVFEEIYEKNVWTYGSGHGSLPEATKGYRRFLEKFIKKNRIKTIVDFGCGDWQFSKLVNWQDVKYHGYDIVDSLIEFNIKNYGNTNIKFSLTPDSWLDLKEAELLIVKDVLQHLSNEEVTKFINIASKKYKFMLITNGTNPSKMTNSEIKTGEYRPLDIRKNPFNLKANRTYSFKGPRKNARKLNFSSSWSKDVLLITKE